MSRPTKYTAEIVDGLCNWIKMGNTYADACAIEGISFQTFNEWRKQYPEFSDAIKKAESRCKAMRIARILQASEKSWQAAAWWLERRYPDEYALKKIVDAKFDTTNAGPFAVCEALVEKIRSNNRQEATASQ